jgi:hypothetical protein
VNLCGKCGKEILPGEEEYRLVNGHSFLLPHKKCREELEAEIDDPKWKPKQWAKKKKP